MRNKKLTLTETPQTYTRLKNMRKNSIVLSYCKTPGERIKSQEKNILKTLALWLLTHSEHRTKQAILSRIILTF